MGVDRSDHIVYGWKLPYDLKDSNGNKIDFWDKKFLSMIEGHPGEEFTIIIDGMSGKYVVFGLKVESCYDDSGEGWDFTNLDINDFDAEDVKSEYRKVFELKEDEIITEPYLFIFSHYS